MKAEEPIFDYNVQQSAVQHLQQQISTYAKKTSDLHALRESLADLKTSEMPCRFSQEELDKEVLTAEKSSYDDHETFLNRIQSWHHAI